MDLTGFADAVGLDGPVTIAGLAGRGGPVPGVRCVAAPAGIGTFLPEEMTVSCGAGTPVAELQAALAERGQSVALPDGGTVGGALAVGHAGLLRLGHGPVRDALLQCHTVLADGSTVMAGGTTVKNVSGFDLCRLFVGAQGTLGFFGTVLLRTRPEPAARRWFRSDEPATAVRRRLFRPSAVLWNGAATIVCLEGHPADVAEQAAGAGLVEVEGPPPVPAGARRPLASDDPALVGLPAGSYLVELGVGVVHLADAAALAAPRIADPGVVALHGRLKRLFDPDGRLNPGRAPAGAEPVAIGSVHP